MHEKGGTFCIFRLEIAEKEGKTDLEANRAAAIQIHLRERQVSLLFRELNMGHLAEVRDLFQFDLAAGVVI